ncbi:MAG: hypothetical protein RSG23_09455 [Gordonibacter sp.]
MKASVHTFMVAPAFLCANNHPELVVPGYLLHIKVSSLAECVYYDYSDRVEPFGPDEVWIDVSGTQRRLGLTPEEIACEISERMKAELGTTVSVGVSWSKIFAKFGSEHKKPDAVTVIDEYNYQYVVWRAQGRELLYVRTAIERKKHSSGICTIGDLLMRRITTCSTG